MLATSKKCFSSIIIRSIYTKFTVYTVPLQKNDNCQNAFTLFKPNKYTSSCNITSKCFHVGVSLQKNVPFILSDIGEGIREVVIKEWFVNVGDEISQFENICEVQSDKASVTITSRYDGRITKLCHQVDDIALVGKPLVEIEVKDMAATVEDSQESPVFVEEITPRESAEDHVPLSPAAKIPLAIPSVRKFAKEHNIDLNLVSPTGKDGRVSKEDVETFILNKLKPTPSKSDLIKSTLTRTEPIKGFMKAMTKSMTSSLKIPHFVYTDEISLTKLISIREEVKNDLTHKGIKLTYMPFFIKSASKALLQFPILNSSLDENCENIIYKLEHNIGVAMDTLDGLVVPNIKNVQQKSILQIARDLNRLQDLGQKRALTTDDLTGGTFTISNIGIIGGTYMKPVILAPEVSIGAIGKIQVVPRFDSQGRVVPESIINVSWAADHRIIDGVTMAKFSNFWKYYLENPNLLLLDA